MQPQEKFGVDEIALSDPHLWQQPEEVIEGAFVTLRRERPVSFHREVDLPMVPAGPGYWAITRYEDIVEVTRDSETFCNRHGYTINDFPPAFAGAFDHMLAKDGTEHARLRRIVSRAFAPAVLAKLQGSMDDAAREIVDGIVDRGGEFDFVREVGGWLPVRIICDMLGVPASQYEFVYEQSSVIMFAADPAYLLGAADLESSLGRILTATTNLMGMLLELANERRGSPRDDVLSLLVNADVNGESLTDQELAQFVLLVTVAGNETTRSASALGMEALHRYPEQKKLWRSDLTGYAATAASEIIRWGTPFIQLRRTATRDTTVDDQAIAEGDKVVLFFRSGNRDETVFGDPYSFRVDRPQRPAHLAFGAPGPHYCLGAHLARTEIETIFVELLRRVPDIDVVGDIPHTQGNFMHGIPTLTCRATPVGH